MTLNENSNEMSISDVLRLLWRNKVLILCSMIAASVFAVFVASRRPPVFSGRTYVGIDPTYEQLEILGMNSGNFVALQFKELIDAEGTQQFLGSDAGEISSVRLDLVQTPSVIRIIASGVSAEAVKAFISEIPKRLSEHPYIRSYGIRAKEMVASELEMLSSLSKPGGKNSLEEAGRRGLLSKDPGFDPYVAVINLNLLNRRIKELQRLSEEESFLARIGSIEEPAQVPSRTKLNAILGLVFGLLIGLTISLIMNNRSKLGRT